MRLLIALLALSAMLSLPARAADDMSSAYRARAGQLLAILSKPGGETDFFSTLFLDAVPAAQWRDTAADLRRQHGSPIALGAIQPESATTALVEIRYERATLGFTLVVAPQLPNRVVGLQIIGVQRTDDDMASVLKDIAALPGKSAFSIARLDDSGPVWLYGHRADAMMATASSFKLVILAELARAVAAGDRRWSDAVPLAHKSFSGRLLKMPNAAPMTLHSLAVAMIAESDNSAADTLMAALGRDRIDAMVARSAHSRPDATLPLLTTTEAFALKMPANTDLAQRYAAATPNQRRALIAANVARLTAGMIDIGTIAEMPVAIDTIEWFATPQDMIRLLDWLWRQSDETRAIMALNPGIAAADAGRWRVIGYKGGSEPGVMAMNFLAQAKDGRWYGVSGSWNDTTARVDEPRFVALMTRALNILSQ